MCFLSLSKCKYYIILILFLVILTIGCYYWYSIYNKKIVIKPKSWQSINTVLNNQATQLHLDDAQSFVSNNNNNYGALVSMGLARQFSERGDFSSAQKYLEHALTQTSEANLQSIINLRLARLQLQQSNLDGALKTLDKIKMHGWTVLAEDIRGDVQLIKGNKNIARTCYEKVLNYSTPYALKALVRMKLSNISS